ncbi:CHASE domain-containing protein [Cognatilysobacter segetis]|uniref:CHASE domain-containing protein n=1 Tax=Cognatilysobacter segetis TaxID=2492394 RepID=UPI00138FB369|nr:CHASE domain-containing protein [Lysobacter segetis]
MPTRAAPLPTPPPAPRRFLGSPGAQSLLVFVITLLVTGALVAGVAMSIRRQDRLAFDYEVERTREAIEQRLTVTGNLLRGTAGLFEASHEVTSDEFRRYVDTLQLRTRYPGILGIGFARWLPPEDVASFEAGVRAQGRPGFRVWPEGPRPLMSSIVFLEPMDRRNAAAIGFDMLTEPTRRAAMLAARERGELVASGKVTLVQEIDPAKQAGFLMYLPVYAHEEDGARSGFLGFVYSPLRVGDLLAGTRGPGAKRIDYALYDGDRAEPSALLRDTRQRGEAPGRLTAERRLLVGGRPWRVRYSSRPALDDLSQRWLVPWLALAALAASALLASLSWLQGRARVRAEAAVAAERVVALTLHREREWLGATLSSIDDAVIAVDAGERVTWMNPVAERLTGWSRHDALGQPFGAVVHLLRTGDEATAPDGLHGRGGAMLRARDGEVRPVDHSRAPIREANGETSGAVIVMHDASERYRTEAELRENDRRKDEFLAMLAHELRNPLAPISTAATLLRMPQLDAARVQHASAVILRQVGHMTELVDDLLDVSRVTRGLVQLDREVFDVREAVRAAAEQVNALIERLHHVLVLDLGDAPLHVDGDRTRLTQVVANLLNNAAKYTPPGGRIRVDAHALDGQVMLRVEDTGIGMDAALLPRVFDLFTQAERSLDRSQGGLGIGLALVRSVVELHGGHVRALSAGPGRGSAFEVVLPRAVAPASPIAAAAGPAPRAPGAALRIVVVDDNDDAAQTLALLLQTLGHHVRTYPTAEDAEAALDPATDAYILDIGLPGISGYEFARRLRADPRSAHAALFALSGYGQQADLEASQDAGFAEHFVKPVEADRLLRALATVTGSTPDS